MDIYRLKKEEVIQKFGTRISGLDTREVVESRNANGANRLPDTKGRGYIRIFIDQFKSAVIYVLLGAALIVAVMGSVSDATIIFVVLLINAAVGVYQEGKAENTLLALKKMTEATVTVMREGQEVIVKDTELVVGDVLVLREGDKVGADARLVQADSLVVDESILTGESVPVQKDSDHIDRDRVEVFDQVNMVFKGTNITNGNGMAIVTSVGVHSYIGTVSKELSGLDTDVPLKRKIGNLSRSIIYIVLCLCALVFLIGVSRGFSATEMFMGVVALAVSAIPEGLPVTVTLILVTGVHRMSKQNALVKKLQAVEALGQADVIATDKTGTLTHNQMQVEKIWVDGQVFDVTGTGYEPKGQFLLGKSEIDVKLHNGLFMLLKQSAFVSGGTVAYDTEKGMWQRISGDPTEVSFNILAQKSGFSRQDLLAEFPLVKEIPFSSASKYHATIHEIAGGYNTAIVGAPEALLEQSTHVFSLGKNVAVTDEYRQEFAKQMKKFSSQGYRVLSVAYRETKGDDFETDLSNLTFLGLVAISDAIRKEASDSVLKAKGAGVKVVMITGDHKDTAEAIATRVSIFEKGDLIITGSELDTLPKERILEMLPKVSVFARVSPEHKLKIIDLYRSVGKTIAMTGDGVNDALSIASADLGISMGKSGTEVAKEASDIVLLDDNFTSIVSAIEEGRVIYRTIKKVVTYLFATSVGEILVIGGAIAIGYPLPITPSQIIWLNFVTDGFLVIALAMEYHIGSVMKGRQKHSNSIIDMEMLLRMAMVGAIMMFAGLYVFSTYLPLGTTYASTVTLTLLAVIQWFNAWSCRSEHQSIFKIPIFGNPYMWYATCAVIFLQYMAVSYPPLMSLMGTTHITGSDWILIVLLSLSVVVADEVRKLFQRTLSKISS
ncbi:MAG: HAD-IC family P-type ATPase [Candidatus Taylorbacteria bacterium]|nr:HAD-IC family P-type ATPase [Candidatus Taylorbacteria bacterium]